MDAAKGIRLKEKDGIRLKEKEGIRLKEKEGIRLKEKDAAGKEEAEKEEAEKRVAGRNAEEDERVSDKVIDWEKRARLYNVNQAEKRAMRESQKDGRTVERKRLNCVVAKGLLADKASLIKSKEEIISNRIRGSAQIAFNAVRSRDSAMEAWLDEDDDLERYDLVSSKEGKGWSPTKGWVEVPMLAHLEPSDLLAYSRGRIEGGDSHLLASGRLKEAHSIPVEKSTLFNAMSTSLKHKYTIGAHTQRSPSPRQKKVGVQLVSHVRGASGPSAPARRS